MVAEARERPLEIDALYVASADVKGAQERDGCR